MEEEVVVVDTRGAAAAGVQTSEVSASRVSTGALQEVEVNGA